LQVNQSREVLEMSDNKRVKQLFAKCELTINVVRDSCFFKLLNEAYVDGKGVYINTDGGIKSRFKIKSVTQYVDDTAMTARFELREV